MNDDKKSPAWVAYVALAAAGFAIYRTFGLRKEVDFMGGKAYERHKDLHQQGLTNIHHHEWFDLSVEELAELYGEEIWDGD